MGGIPEDLDFLVYLRVVGRSGVQVIIAVPNKASMGGLKHIDCPDGYISEISHLIYMWASEWAGPVYLLFWLPCMERQLIAGIGGGAGGKKRRVWRYGYVGQIGERGCRGVKERTSRRRQKGRQ